MGWLGLWWQQSDHYDQLSKHLQARGMTALTCVAVSSIAATLAAISLATIWSPIGPRGVVQLGCTLAAAGGAAVGAVVGAALADARASDLVRRVVQRQHCAGCVGPE